MKRLPVLATVIVCLFGFCAGRASAETTWYVDDDAPADFATIQAAINAASGGDTIRVAEGHYTENLIVSNTSLFIEGGWDASFTERDWDANITTMDGGGSGWCLAYMNCEGGEVSGFTITNGRAYGTSPNREGAGIHCYSSSPTITHNLITGNEAEDYGGGVFCDISSPAIIGNTIVGNSCNRLGGGISCRYSSPTISDNTITGNTTVVGGDWGGGGIDCSSLSSPAITNNVIAGNTAGGAGGGIRCSGSVPIISGNIIASNEVKCDGGGGIYLIYSSPVIANNIISGNKAERLDWSPYSYGGGVYCCDAASPSLVNNTIFGNSANGFGGGICAYDCTLPLVTNSIIWGNTASNGNQVGLRSRDGAYPSAVTVKYCDIAGGHGGVFVEQGCILTWGPGNIDVSPGFADPDNGDYHLKSEYGRWDPTANGGEGAWVFDGTTSECIDAGDPTSDFSLETQGNGGRNNIGAYGNTEEASRSSIAPTHTLTVLSIPISSVAITGDKPGVTDYTATCDDQEVVNLTAPFTVTDATVRYDFVRWIVDGTDQPIGQTDVQITVDADMTATAVYSVKTHTLTVSSLPANGVAVNGDEPGTTPYTATCDDQQLVALAAPVILPGGSSRTNHFLYWVVDDVAQPYGQDELQLTMDTDHKATAVYDWRLPGDVTGDCLVNVLDMIFVRNHARTACSE